jgi:hypothetical protein
MGLIEGTNCGFCLVAPVDDPAEANRGPCDNYAVAGKFVAPADAASISEIGWWCDSASEAADFEVGIYAHDDVNNRPGALLASAAAAAKGTTAGWKKSSVAYDLTGGTTYWLGIQVDDTATQTSIDYLENAAQKYDYKGTPMTALPSPWAASNGTFGRYISIYAVYVAAGGGATKIIPESLALTGLGGMY